MTFLKKQTFPNSFLFDDVFNSSFNQQAFSASATPDYNIVKHGDSAFTITVAVPGLDEENIDITEQNGYLKISFLHDTAETEQNENDTVILRQGLQTTPANLEFKLAEHVIVNHANLKKGLLDISLKREIPEALQPKRIAIGAAA